MRPSSLLVAIATWAGLVGETWAAGCSSNNCLRAVQKAPSGTRNGTADCISFFQATVTPATKTIFSTVTSSSTTTRNVTLTRNATSTITAEPSKRWLAQHEVVDALRGALPLEGRQVTVTATAMPSYASPCLSLAAYSSACSCLGVSRVTITASTPSATQIVTTTSFTVTNRTSTLWHNATTTVQYNASLSITSSSSETSITTDLSSTDPSSTETSGGMETSSSTEALSSLTTANSSAVFSNTTSFSSLPTSIKVIDTSTTDLPSNTSSSAIFANSTTTAQFTNTTNTPSFNTSSSAVFANSTTTALFSNTTTAPFFNFSSTAHFVNTSTTEFLNSTTARFANTTTASFLNTTTGLFPNTTTSGRFLNTTSLPIVNATTTAPYRNTTGKPSLNATCSGWYRNSTCGHYQNTTTSSTKTVDKTCGETAKPFAVQVSQPGGLFDKWWLKLSGNEVLFTSSANMSSQFSVEGSGHLCAVGYNGTDGNAIVAIVGTLDNGSPLYFVDSNQTDTLEPKGSYGDLECSLGSGLSCTEGEYKNWVGCGLMLDLTNESGNEVVIDKFNCTAVTLAPIYS